MLAGGLDIHRDLEGLVPLPFFLQEALGGRMNVSVRITAFSRVMGKVRPPASIAETRQQSFPAIWTEELEVLPILLINFPDVKQLRCANISIRIPNLTFMYFVNIIIDSHVCSSLFDYHKVTGSSVSIFPLKRFTIPGKVETLWLTSMKAGRILVACIAG